MAVDWTAVRSNPKCYTVIVSDNFHYMDPDADYAIMGFDNAEDAVAKCQSIVESFLAECAKQERDPDRIYETYVHFGEDPWIVSPEGLPSVKFSAWNYAKENAHRFV
jgi:hypothetical protein